MGFSESGAFADVLEFSYVSVSLSVSTTQVEAKVGASRLQSRQELILFNDSSITVYFGPTGVTASGSTKGIQLLPGEFLQIPFGDQVAVYMIAASGSATIIVQELA